MNQREKTPCVLTFDVGTTSVKTVLTDKDMHQLACDKREYILETEKGFVEMDPQAYLDAVIEGAKAVLRSAPEAYVCGVSFVTQGETLIPVDSSGKALRKAIVWLDARAEAEAEDLAARFSPQTVADATGLPGLTGACPIAKLLWLKKHEPEVYSKTHKFLLLEDWLILSFTGMVCTEKSLLSSTGYFNLATDDYWYDILEYAGIDRQLLPEALEPGARCGVFLDGPADKMNIPRNTPVFAGAMDQVASSMGADAMNEKTVTETTGTALVVAAFSRGRKYGARQGLTEYRHIFKDTYLNLSFSSTAGILLKWFKDEFCRDVVSECRDSGENVFARLDVMAEKTAPLSNGLMLFPYFEGTDDGKTNVKGAYVGIGLNTTRADFIRAILEGVAYMLRRNMEALGCDAQEIRSLGGASESAVWCAIKADVTRKKILTYRGEATSRGAAALAAWGLGWYADIETALGKAQRSAQYTCSENAALYEAGYADYIQKCRDILNIYT